MNLPLKKRKYVHNNDYQKIKKIKSVDYLKKILIMSNINDNSLIKLNNYDYDIISYLLLKYLILCEQQSKEIKKNIYTLLDETIESIYGKEIIKNIHKKASKIIYLLINNYIHE